MEAKILQKKVEL